MGCLIQIIILAVCTVVGFGVLSIPGAVIGFLVGLYCIAKLNSH